MLVVPSRLGAISGMHTRNKGGGGPTWAEWIDGLTETQVLDIDFAQTDRHWQEYTANTVSDDAGENIGFASDSATWGTVSYAALMAAQTELVTNGDFSSGAGWTVAAGVTFGGGAALFSAVNTSSALYRTAAVSIGTFYEINAAVTAASAGSVTPRFFGGLAAPAGSIAAPGTRRGIDNPTTSSQNVGCGANTFTGALDSLSVKKVPGNHGIQASASLQGKRQAGGVCRYDGTDDNHLTTFKAQSGSMTLLYHGTIDAVVSATQMFLGASGSGANRCWLAVTTSGFIAAGVGDESTSTIVGATDVRGKTIVAALTFDGTTVKLFLRVDGSASEQYSAAQVSIPTTTIPFRVGAYNNNGTAAGFAKVDAKRLRAAHKAMTFNDFKSIAAALVA